MATAVVLSNLVVLGGRDLPVDEVVSKHPAHVIHVDRACADAALPSIVLRSIRGDVPTTLWWADETCSDVPAPLLELSRQLLFDSRRWSDVEKGIRALQPVLEDRRVHCIDVNWRRLAPVRHALLHAGDQLRREDLHHGEIRIAYRRGERALAALLVGWLAARMQWSGLPHLEETGSDDALLAIDIGVSGEPTTLTLRPPELTVNQRGWPPYTIAVRVEDEPTAIAAELKSLHGHPWAREALLALGRLISATSF